MGIFEKMTTHLILEKMHMCAMKLQEAYKKLLFNETVHAIIISVFFIAFGHPLDVRFFLSTWESGSLRICLYEFVTAQGALLVCVDNVHK